MGIDSKLKYLSKYGHNILLQLWDSSGPKKYRNVINHFVARMMAVIPVVDVTSTDSLSLIGHQIEVIRRHALPETQESEEPCGGMLHRGNFLSCFDLKSEVHSKTLKSYAINKTILSYLVDKQITLSIHVCLQIVCLQYVLMILVAPR